MKAINIQWDVDSPEELGALPNEIAIPDEIANSDDDDAISDYISDVTGFCTKGFFLEPEQQESGLDTIIAEVRSLLKESEEAAADAAAGYDEGWYNGESNAYQTVLELLQQYNCI